MSSMVSTLEETLSLPASRQGELNRISENGLEVLRRRYLRKGLDGKPTETVQGMFWRVASHVALPERAYGDEAEYQATAERFYDLLTELRFFPNSPTFTGAGTPLGQLAACFVLAIDDDMGKDSAEGIFNTLRNAALIQQTGGGNGFSFSRLRPKSDPVNSSAGVASGPVGFLRVYDAAFGEIAQGGSRRGANMAVLRIDHPDIEEFISCKAEEGHIPNFNISVGVTDDFMQAVNNDADFDLVSPRTGKVIRTVRARALFDQIITYAHRNGEPGVLFLDAANRSNPVPHLYELEATNPCVTGDTLIYTSGGLHKAKDLYDSQQPQQVVLDGRFGVEAHTSEASPVFYTGRKPVYRLHTSEGYELDATSDHQIMTVAGWRTLQELQPGDKVHILNRKGGFGPNGTLGLGRTLGWLIGDGTFNIADGAGLLFFGDEQELAPEFAGYVNNFVGVENHRNIYAPTRTYQVSAVPVAGRQETRVVSGRMKERLAGMGVADKEQVPTIVFTGTEEMQRGFLQGLFSSDGTILDDVSKGVSVRLWSSKPGLLKDVQRLLLNFGIASKVYLERKMAGYKWMPDGHGQQREYFAQAGHELVISRQNLVTFRAEIGFLQPAKAERLAAALESYGSRGPYAEYFTATVQSIEWRGEEPVYDLTEPLTHSFVANGIVVHNCGEQFLGPYENCCLGSINLAQHVTADGQIDWAALEQTVVDSTRFLDDVVSANKYVPAVPQLQDAAHRVRRIGLGIMGLADVMYKIGVRYGDAESLDLAGQAMEFVRYHCMRTSIELARERGPFPAISGSIYDPDRLLWQPPTPLQPYSHQFGRPELDWSVIVAGIKAHGIRNGAQTTIAPTGTIGTVTGCEGYGCEPVFALAYTRYVKEAGGDVTLTYVSPLFLEALDRAGIAGERRERIVEQIVLTGTCQHIDELPQELQHTFVVSQDITPAEHVLMQATLQRYVDNSISKTCNFPSEAAPDDVAQAYVQAWELGCKGLTVYVTGSRQEVVLETKATAEAKKGGTAAEPVANGKVESHQPLAAVARPPMPPEVNGNGAHTASYGAVDYDAKRPRPRRLHGATYRRLTPLGTAYVTVNDTDEGEPFEIFMNVGKAGSDVAAVSEALGRLISLVLRMPSSLTPTERLQQVVFQLNGIGGGRHLGFGPQRVRSLPDAIAQVLSEHLEQAPAPQPVASAVPAEQLALPIPKQIGDLCPDCGNSTLLNVEGCVKCHVCGYSEC
jgi:ribonucleoside-diphosphate reductase alpha chain